MFCNCTLAGTKACENCNSSAKILNILWDDVFPTIYYPKPIKNYTYKVYDFSSREWYNPETHELVEKKDAKIKRIKTSIEASKRQKDNNIALVNQSFDKIKEFRGNIRTCEEDIAKLEQELKELES